LSRGLSHWINGVKSLPNNDFIELHKAPRLNSYWRETKYVNSPDYTDDLLSVIYHSSLEREGLFDSLIVPYCSNFTLLADHCAVSKFLNEKLERRPQVVVPRGGSMSKSRAKHFSYEYARPALTVDIAIVTREARPKVLLIRRKNKPFAGSWALPGGFVNENERLADAARRELREETGIVTADVEQVYTAGDPGRDPRGWTVSVVYLAQVNPVDVRPQAADDAAEVAWYPLDELPVLAFDHSMLLTRVRARLLDHSE
jgi:8-oxo-dGTP diphosphatase